MTITNGKEKGIAVGVVKNPAGKVLIMDRIRKETGADGSKLTWVFPGGKLDGSETFEDAVVREILLETGFKVKVNKLISERVHPQFEVPIKYFACELAEFRTRPIQEIHEVSTIRWVDVSELRDYFTTDIDPNVAKFLKI
ncbi:NUDIX hydrolase [candidate division WWE3 bacterium]|jgi:8-oxo-dGTP diphosphatase|uniref:NUDIX hydrolase n=1 Tax=candidate division WWE3 bacterium TaxID=2053526 RepID=A0A3A4ZJW7_UNCKA|nr:MAG: NUDIX hydrolase [candidate division WWE3 bacterium]